MKNRICLIKHTVEKEAKVYTETIQEIRHNSIPLHRSNTSFLALECFIAIHKAKAYKSKRKTIHCFSSRIPVGQALLPFHLYGQ